MSFPGCDLEVLADRYHDEEQLRIELNREEDQRARARVLARDMLGKLQKRARRLLHSA